MMKTCTILCPGPSLAKAKLVPDAIVIGVNRAVLRAPCDWWVFLNAEVFQKTHPAYPSRVLTSDIARNMIGSCQKSKQRLEAAIPLMLDDLTPEFPTAIGWTIYSATASLCLAAHVGAKSISVYGADWTDEPDWDGIRLNPTGRDAGRWASERHIWDATVSMLAERGIEIRRHQP